VDFGDASGTPASLDLNILAPTPANTYQTGGSRHYNRQLTSAGIRDLSALSLTPEQSLEGSDE